MKAVAWILALGGLSVAACAHGGSEAGPAVTPGAGGESAVTAAGTASADEQALRRRVNEWWEAREYRDYRTMYALYERAMRRRLTLEDYRAQAIPRDRLDISAHEVKTVTLKDRDRATVRLGYRVRLPQLPQAIMSLMDEDWVREGGRWYKVYFVPEPLTPGSLSPPPGAPAPPMPAPFPSPRPGQPAPSPSPVG